MKWRGGSLFFDSELPLTPTLSLKGKGSYQIKFFFVETLYMSVSKNYIVSSSNPERMTDIVVPDFNRG